MISMQATKREVTLTVILALLSVAVNVYLNWQSEPLIWPDEMQYQYPGVFDNTAIMYKPDGYPGWKILDLDESIIVVTEFGPPVGCAQLTVHAPDGEILVRGGCVQGLVDE